MPVVGAHSRLSIFGWWLTQQAGGVEVACDEEEEEEEDDEEANEDEDDEECPELLAPSTEGDQCCTNLVATNCPDIHSRL